MSALTEISVLSLPFLSRPVVSVAAVVLVRLIFVAVLTAVVGDHLERLGKERLRRHFPLSPMSTLLYFLNLVGLFNNKLCLSADA